MALKKFEGNGKFNREDLILMFDANITSIDENGIVYGDTSDWTPIGEDNDEIKRDINNEVESKKNVLGKTNTNHSGGPQTTEIDPVAIRGNDVLSVILYNIYKYDLRGDKAKLRCIEVSSNDKQANGSYGAFTESAIVDLKTYGGGTSEIDAPITLNWQGDKVHGTFDATTKEFTATTAE